MAIALPILAIWMLGTGVLILIEEWKEEKRKK